MALTDLAGPAIGPYLAGLVLLGGIIGTCLYPVTVTNSARGRVLVSMSAAGVGGLCLLTSPWQAGFLDLSLACLMLVAIVPSVWRGRDWPHSVIPTDHDGDQMIGNLSWFGAAVFAGHVTSGGIIVSLLPLVGVAVAGTMYYQFYMRMKNATDKRFELRHGRTQGTTVNPMFGGGLLATLIVLGAAQQMWWAVVAMLPALVLTRSRGGYLAALVGLAWVLGPWAWAVAAGILVTVIVRDPRSRLCNLFYELRAGRVQAWRACVYLISERPWLGYGQNTFRVMAQDSGNMHKNPHNGLLYVAHAWGLPGLAAYVWVMQQGLVHAAPVVLPALMAYLLWEQFAWPYYGPANAFWVLLGLGARA